MDNPLITAPEALKTGAFKAELKCTPDDGCYMPMDKCHLLFKRQFENYPPPKLAWVNFENFEKPPAGRNLRLVDALHSCRQGSPVNPLLGKDSYELQALLIVFEGLKEKAPYSSSCALSTKAKPNPLKRKENPNKDQACHHCHVAGHWKRNCPLYIEELRANKKKSEPGVAVSGLLENIDEESFDKCVSLVYGKMTRTERKPLIKILERATDLLFRFNTVRMYADHLDMCQGKVFKAEVELQLGKKIKALRSDRGGEYLSQEFKDYLKSAVRILNMVPTKKVDKTPYEIWHGKAPNLSYLKQASRQWNKRFDEEIKRFGFTQNRDEPCVYRKASGSNVVFLILYVDDILIMGNNIPRLKEVKDYLGKCFSMKDLGEVAYILGIKIYRDRSLRLIGLNQSAYIDKILKKFNTKLEVTGFCDASWQCDKDDTKSQTGYVFVVNRGAVDWKSKKQTTIAMHATLVCVHGLASASEAQLMEAFGLGSLLRILVMPSIT
ncbi:putative retrotransposon protein [Tanacetum coccineum]